MGPPHVGLLVIVAGAAALRLFRHHQAKKRAEQLAAEAGHSQSASTQAPRPRHLGYITPAALSLLVETNALHHSVIEALSSDGSTTGFRPLATRMSAGEACAVLSSPPLWDLHCSSTARGGPPPDYPLPHALLCIVSTEAAAAEAVARAAAAAGFHRVTITIISTPPPPPLPTTNPTAPAEAESSAAQQYTRQSSTAHLQFTSGIHNIQYLSRDALAAILGYSTQPVALPICLIDVRRHDERTLYGSIRGSWHLPGEQLPCALALPPLEFQALYHWQKPAQEEVVVLCSRTSRRAAWAAQVCCDLGYSRVYVYRQGMYGWRLDQSVLPYPAYSLGEPPPEPEPFHVDGTDEGAAMTELVRLGLVRPRGPPAPPPPAQPGSVAGWGP